jgi:iron-sulfur cluster repair protein YtfE (RIC family)
MNDTVHRHDFYAGIHKALRMALGRMLVRLGNVDAADQAAVAQLMSDLREQLKFSAVHLKHEDEVIHTALAAHAPEAVAALADDHDHHRATFAALETAIVGVEAALFGGCERPLHALYIAFSQFMAEDFAHMAHEETVVMPLLQSIFSDEDLRAMEHRIVASQPPETAVVSGRAILCAIRPAERLALAAGARANMPPEAFQGMLAALTPALEPVDRARLLSDLGMAA